MPPLSEWHGMQFTNTILLIDSGSGADTLEVSWLKSERLIIRKMNTVKRRIPADKFSEFFMISEFIRIT
jgi:hypothetical protein